MHHSIHEHTYLGLHAWSKNMIERAGWIILSSSHGDKTHVKSYISKLSCLLKCIKDKITAMKKRNDNSHHLHELEILYSEVSHIKDFFNVKTKRPVKIVKTVKTVKK